MKKNYQDKILFNPDITSNKDLEKDKIKTTNVNILLNRVRLDQKKILKKKIRFVAVLLFSISSLIYFLYS